MARKTLNDWTEEDLDSFDRLLDFEIRMDGAKDVFGWARQALRTIRAAKGTADRWIPTSESVPKNRVPVLVVFTKDGAYKIGTGYVERVPFGMVVWHVEDHGNVDPMYWRPIPALPARWPGQTV